MAWSELDAKRRLPRSQVEVPRKAAQKVVSVRISYSTCLAIMWGVLHFLELSQACFALVACSHVLQHAINVTDSGGSELCLNGAFKNNEATILRVVSG